LEVHTRQVVSKRVFRAKGRAIQVRGADVADRVSPFAALVKAASEGVGQVLSGWDQRILGLEQVNAIQAVRSQQAGQEITIRRIAGKFDRGYRDEGGILEGR
jgi:hypothetical protein